MQDLRDKLLKAGLASKKQAREARTEKRRKRKKQGGAKADQQQQEQQQQRYQEKLEQQAQESRELEAQRAHDRAEKERLNRIENVIRRHALLKPFGNDRAFYFMGRDRRIRRLDTTHVLAERLAQGELAIVERRDDPRRDFAVVDAASARKLEQIEASDWILFWNKPGEQTGDLPFYGAG